MNNRDVARNYGFKCVDRAVDAIYVGVFVMLFMQMLWFWRWVF